MRVDHHPRRRDLNKRSLLSVAAGCLMAFGVQAHLYPEKKQFLQYTTTSPVMQQRLGVTAI